MMRVFATMNIWGKKIHWWDAARTGALGFPSVRSRDNFMSNYKSDDWVLYFGTVSAPTPIDRRGRLIALVRLGKKAVLTADLIEPKLWSEVLKENRGAWNYGLPVVAAEQFVSPLPVAREVISRLRSIRKRAMSRAPEPLLAEEVEAILACKRERIPARDIYSGRVS